jgi:hypothetical protein
LQSHPQCLGIASHVAVQNATAVMTDDDEEAVQNTKRQCGNGKEVHRRDGFTMVTQKRQPVAN